MEMAIYKLCLLDPAGKIAAVRRFWADSDKDALTIARSMIEGDPGPAGFKLLRGPRRIAAETRPRVGEMGKKKPRR